MTDNYNKKISNANSNVVRNSQTKHFYRKEYYIIFFTILILSFLSTYWLCNFTKLRDLFQIMCLSALSVALAEYFTRKYFKKE